MSGGTLARLSSIYERVRSSPCRWREMSSIASGVEELRVRDRSGAYRVFYYTRLADSVSIFHAFAKKTQKTLPQEIALAQKRLKEMLDEES